MKRVDQIYSFTPALTVSRGLTVSRAPSRVEAPGRRNPKRALGWLSCEPTREQKGMELFFYF